MDDVEKKEKRVTKIEKRFPSEDVTPVVAPQSPTQLSYTEHQCEQCGHITKEYR